jgi:hypothetical protein
MTKFETLLAEATAAAKADGAHTARRTDQRTFVSVLVFNQWRGNRESYTQQWSDADGNRITKAQAAAIINA